MKKTHINSLENLLSKYSKQEILANIDKLNFDKADLELKDKIFATDQTAVEWFKNFCAQYNLTVTRATRTNKEGRLFDYGLYYVEEFGQSGYNKQTKEYTPYFMLWINDGHQNADQTPHIEMGSDFSKSDGMWWSNGMADLEAKMHKICEMQGIKRR
jgi:hypothetical protein